MTKKIFVIAQLSKILRNYKYHFSENEIFKSIGQELKSQSSLLIHGDRTRPLFSCKTDRSGRDTLDSAIIKTHRANKNATRSDVLNYYPE